MGNSMCFGKAPGVDSGPADCAATVIQGKADSLGTGKRSTPQPGSHAVPAGQARSSRVSNRQLLLETDPGQPTGPVTNITAIAGAPPGPGDTVPPHYAIGSTGARSSRVTQLEMAFGSGGMPSLGKPGDSTCAGSTSVRSLAYSALGTHLSVDPAAARQRLQSVLDVPVAPDFNFPRQGAGSPTPEAVAEYVHNGSSNISGTPVDPPTTAGETVHSLKQLLQLEGAQFRYLKDITTAGAQDLMASACSSVDPSLGASLGNRPLMSMAHDLAGMSAPIMGMNPQFLLASALAQLQATGRSIGVRPAGLLLQRDMLAGGAFGSLGAAPRSGVPDLQQMQQMQQRQLALMQQAQQQAMVQTRASLDVCSTVDHSKLARQPAVAPGVYTTSRLRAFVTDSPADAQQSDGTPDTPTAASPHAASGPVNGPTLSWAGLNSLPTMSLSNALVPDSILMTVSTFMPPTMYRVTWTQRQFRLVTMLHEGYASRVYEAVCLVSGETVALKIYRLAGRSDIERLHLFREVTLHAKLTHPNITQFYAAFKEGSNVYIVTEFIRGGGGNNLRNFMLSYGGTLPEKIAVRSVLKPTMQALLYLHSQAILHRDIKPENVLMSDMGVLKLADFGLAINLNDEIANTRAGTLAYMAPEVLMCDHKANPTDYDKAKLAEKVDREPEGPQVRQYGLAADTWALGVFAYELLVGITPFASRSDTGILRRIAMGQIELPGYLSSGAKDFIVRALTWRGRQRPTIRLLMDHPWIVNGGQMPSKSPKPASPPQPSELAQRDTPPTSTAPSAAPSVAAAAASSVTVDPAALNIEVGGSRASGQAQRGVPAAVPSAPTALPSHLATGQACTPNPLRSAQEPAPAGRLSLEAVAPS